MFLVIKESFIYIRKIKFMQPLKVISDNSTVYNSSNNKLVNSKMEIDLVSRDRAIDQKLVEKSQKGVNKPLVFCLKNF